MGLEQLKQKLQDSVKGVHIETLADSSIASERTWFPTPAFDLNRILSGSLHKGLPSKSLTMLVAPEACFKSSFMCLCAAKAQKEGYTPVIFDTEGAWDKEFVTRWGLDPENILYIYTPWIGKIMTMMGQIIDDEEASKLFLILDSVGGLERMKMIDDATGGDKKVKADQGALQKEIKRMLKMMLNITKGKDSIGMMSGHFFGNPNSYGGADEIGGGKFAKLAPDIIISMKKQFIYENPTGANLKAKGAIVGTEITACTLKNRFYPPFQECKIEIDYKNGINRFAGMLDIGLTCGIVQKSGAWFSMNDERLGQGFVKAMDALANSKVLADNLLGEIETVLETTGYSTVNEEVEEAIKLAEAEAEEPKPSTKGRGKKK
jgi:recombination protein RecA